VTALFFGNGLVSLRVSNPSSTGVRFRSRAASDAEQRPRLVATTGAGTTAPLAADAGTDLTGSGAGPLTFTASATGGVPPYTFHWDFGESGSATRQTATHAYQSPGSFTVTLTVVDTAGTRATDSARATLAAGPVVASAGLDLTGTAGAALTFRGTASGGVSPYGWTWTFGDGGAATGEIVTHSYGGEGAFTVTLTVTDSAGKQGTDTTLVTIEAAPPPPPSHARPAFPGTTGRASGFASTFRAISA
jgi:PKD repeat protein